LKLPNRLFLCHNTLLLSHFVTGYEKTIFLAYVSGNPMFQQKKDWETRENAFAAFSMGPLTDFWRQREEDEFTGVGASRYASFVSVMRKMTG
jgi:hypothetical protein